MLGDAPAGRFSRLPLRPPPLPENEVRRSLHAQAAFRLSRRLMNNAHSSGTHATQWISCYQHSGSHWSSCRGPSCRRAGSQRQGKRCAHPMLLCGEICTRVAFLEAMTWMTRRVGVTSSNARWSPGCTLWASANSFQPWTSSASQSRQAAGRTGRVLPEAGGCPVMPPHDDAQGACTRAASDTCCLQ